MKLDRTVDVMMEEYNQCFPKFDQLFLTSLPKKSFNSFNQIICIVPVINNCSEEHQSTKLM